MCTVHNLAVLRIRIRDPMPFWRLVPGTGSGMNNQDHISDSLETTIFWLKYLDSLIRIRDGKNSDPGWKKFWSEIRDKNPGSAVWSLPSIKMLVFGTCDEFLWKTFLASPDLCCMSCLASAALSRRIFSDLWFRSVASPASSAYKKQLQRVKTWTSTGGGGGGGG